MADVAFGLRLLLSQHQPQKDTSKEGLFNRGVLLIPYESKDDSYDVFHNFCIQIQSEKELKILKVRSDHGGEFENFKVRSFLGRSSKHNMLCSEQDLYQTLAEQNNI